MGKKGPLWWRESDWLLRGSSAANQILLRHSGPILSTNTETFEMTSENISIPTSVTKTLVAFSESIF